MVNILQTIRGKILEKIISLYPEIDGELSNHVIVEQPDNPDHGDFTTNAAMVLTKLLKKPPRIIADEILRTLATSHIMDRDYLSIAKMEIAGPGFINITFNNKFWLNSINQIIEADSLYGSSNIGRKPSGDQEKVNIEFCSANPTGPLHLGHLRGAIWGDVITNILKFNGYDVEKEFYINDLGGQIEKLIETSYLRYREAFGEKFELKEGCYPGEYLIQTGLELKKTFGDSLLDKSFDEVKDLLHKPVIENMITLIKADLKQLNIEFDNWVFESDIAKSELMDETFDILKAKNLIYEGILEKPKGHADDDYSETSQTIFASTQFGDESDRALKRSDGDWAYFAKDMAYHLYKIKRDFDWLILEVGIDHNGYKKRMTAAVNALSDGKQKFSFEFHNMVYIYSDGIQQKMSKRSGKTVGTKEIIDMIGMDVLRFYIFSKRHDVELDFDIHTAREASKNNPYFYIQYAHARICSILRQANEKMNDLSIAETEFDDIIINKNEKLLVQKLILWPLCINLTLKNLEPHRINFYLQELANLFHGLWNLGANDPALRFIGNGKDQKEILMTKYRLNLVKATQNVFSIGLKLLGVQPLEKM